MKENMGTADKIIRFTAALVLTYLYYMELVTGATAILALLLGVVLFITAIAGYCPLYHILGISTNKKKSQQQGRGDIF